MRGHPVSHAVRWTLVVQLLLGGVAACSLDDSPPRERPTPSPSTATSSTSELPTASPPTGERALPEALIGSWESDSRNDDATLKYRFTADGGYTFVGILTYRNPEGRFQFTFTAEGRARTEDSQLFLNPTRATKSRMDPDDPAGDYTGRPAPLTQERRAWKVTDDGVLELTDENELKVTFKRKSP